VQKQTLHSREHIKGKIRDNFYKITDLNHTENDCNCVMCTIFGGQGYKPSKIYVDDFLPVESESTEIKIWLSDMALQ